MRPFAYNLTVQDMSPFIGGEHFHAHIDYYDRETKNFTKHELLRRVSRKEGKILAAKDGRDFFHYPWERDTHRFNTRKQAERYAIKWCTEHAKDLKDWILIYDDLHNPNIPLAGAGYIVERFELMAGLATAWDKVPNSVREDKTIWDGVYKAWDILLDPNSIIKT